MAATFGVWALAHDSSGSDQKLVHIQVAAGVPTIDFTTALPVMVHTNTAFQSIVRTLPNDRGIVYLGLRDFAGTVYLYRYDSHTATWTLIYSQGFAINLTHIDDIVFTGTLESCVFSVGTLNDYGESFHESSPAQDSWSGLWQSVFGGPAAQLNSGPEFIYRSGNINHPNTIMGLCSGEIAGASYVWATHALTGTGAPGGYSVLSQTVGPTTFIDFQWSLLDAFFFAYCCLMPVQYHAEWADPGIWFLIDTSGTGAYSFANSDEIITMDLATHSPTIVNPTVRSGACGGLFFSGSDNGILFDTGGVEHVWQLTSRGSGMTERIASTPGLAATRWGFAIHPDFPYAIISYSGNTGAAGKLVWTDNEGDSFSEYVTPSLCLDALDFGIAVPPPPPPGVLGQSYTFRDDRGFTSRHSVWFFSPGIAAAAVDAQAIAVDLNDLSNCFLQSASGPYTIPPQAIHYGNASEPYTGVEDLVELTFATAIGTHTIITIPGPINRMFLNDRETVNPADALFSAIVADMLTHNLSNRGGQLLTTFIGGRRVRRSLRRRSAITILNPDLTGPGL